MMPPGPKPVDVGRLRDWAVQWACLFYAVRDGQLGHIQVVEWGPDENVSLGNTAVVRKTVKKVKSRMVVVRPGSSEQSSIERRFKNIQDALQQEGMVYNPPVMPIPKIWELWKKAKSEDNLNDAIKGIRNWAMKLHGGADFHADELTKDGALLAWNFLPFIFRPSWNQEILKAKQLWNYPVTSRPRSDDKRVEFFAKSLAGLTLGLSPATATKRLSHWHWPRNWAEGLVSGPPKP